MGVGVAQYRWRGRGLEVATYIVWRGVCMQSACKPRSWAAKCIITRVGEQNQIESQAKLSPMLPCFTSRPEIVILPRFPVLLLYGIRDLALFIYLKILVVVWRALYIHASKCFTTELYYGSFYLFTFFGAKCLWMCHCLALNSQTSACLPLPSAEIKGVHDRASLFYFFILSQSLMSSLGYFCTHSLT